MESGIIGMHGLDRLDRLIDPLKMVLDENGQHSVDGCARLELVLRDTQHKEHVDRLVVATTRPRQLRKRLFKKLKTYIKQRFCRVNARNYRFRQPLPGSV